MSTIKLKITCPFCKNVNEITVNKEKYEKFKNKQDYIQNIFPELTIDERELLISGVCKDCWNIFMKEDKEISDDV